MSNKKYSLLTPSKVNSYKTLSPVTMHDLGLDTVCKELSPKESEQKYIMNILLKMYADPSVTEYRLGIFEDILCDKMLRDDMMDILNRINFLRDYGSFNREYDEHAGIWDLMHRLDEINDYVKCVDALYECLNSHQIHSKGLIGLKTYVEDIYQNNGFAALKKDILSLKSDTSSLKSLTVGINLNERYEADGIGLISINNKYFTKSKALSNFFDHISSREKINPDTEWKENYKFQPFYAHEPGKFTSTLLHTIESAATTANTAQRSIVNIPDSDISKEITRYTDQIANQMLSSMVKRLKDILNQYVSITITDMTDLIPELMYYIRWAEYIERLMNNGCVFSKPSVHKCARIPESSPETYMRARDIYNIKLISPNLKDTKDIITNDLDFDEEHMLYLLTGANRGGKTTITQAIGQLFVLAQGGIYIPGKEFEFSPVDCIYTHFPADEDKTLDLGRLGEECKRFREIYEKATSRSLLLLNETFSTTSFEEGYYIARDSVRAIREKGIRTIYNTHMHKLAFDIEEMNQEAATGRIYSLVVRNEGSERSYKIELASPSGKSYASDIAKKYGVTYEMLTASIQSKA